MTIPPENQCSVSQNYMLQMAACSYFQHCLILMLHAICHTT